LENLFSHNSICHSCEKSNCLITFSKGTNETKRQHRPKKNYLSTAQIKSNFALETKENARKEKLKRKIMEGKRSERVFPR
jgi:hypothetical protein